MRTIREIVDDSTPSNTISKHEIAKITQSGLENNYDRVYSWLILFDIYPSNSVEWPSKVYSINEEYFRYVDQFGLREWPSTAVPKQCERSDFPVDDTETMRIIHTDVLRTNRILFFLPAVRAPPTDGSDSDDVLFHFQEHLRRIERVLYVCSQLSSDTGYLQGYNELVSPFYVLLAKTLDLWNDNLDFAESLCYALFSNLMKKSDTKQFFTQNKSSQCESRIARFVELEGKHVPAAAEVISSLKIHPTFFCMRWFSLLFSQEYDLPDLMLVWDCLFSHIDEITEYSYYIGLGQLKVVEHKLDKSDYGATLSNLQNLKIGSNLPKVINYANTFWNEDHRGFFSTLLSWVGF